jgi:hypothetical protein
LYCQEHASSNDSEQQQLTNADFDLHKTFIIDLNDELYRKKTLPPRFYFANKQGVTMPAVCVMIGSLQVTQLGDLDVVSDQHYDYLSPVDYECSRLYWSTTELGKLSVYKCRIRRIEDVDLNRFARETTDYSCDDATVTKNASVNLASKKPRTKRDSAKQINDSVLQSISEDNNDAKIIVPNGDINDGTLIEKKEEKVEKKDIDMNLFSFEDIDQNSSMNKNDINQDIAIEKKDDNLELNEQKQIQEPSPIISTIQQLDGHTDEDNNSSLVSAYTNNPLKLEMIERQVNASAANILIQRGTVASTIPKFLLNNSTSGKKFVNLSSVNSSLNIGQNGSQVQPLGNRPPPVLRLEAPVINNQQANNPKPILKLTHTHTFKTIPNSNLLCMDKADIRNEPSHQAQMQQRSGDLCFLAQHSPSQLNVLTGGGINLDTSSMSAHLDSMISPKSDKSDSSLNNDLISNIYNSMKMISTQSSFPLASANSSVSYLPIRSMQLWSGEQESKSARRSSSSSLLSATKKLNNKSLIGDGNESSSSSNSKRGSSITSSPEKKKASGKPRNSSNKTTVAALLSAYENKNTINPTNIINNDLNDEKKMNDNENENEKVILMSDDANVIIEPSSVITDISQTKSSTNCVLSSETYTNKSISQNKLKDYFNKKEKCRTKKRLISKNDEPNLYEESLISIQHKQNLDLKTNENTEDTSTNDIDVPTVTTTAQTSSAPKRSKRGKYPLRNEYCDVDIKKSNEKLVYEITCEEDGLYIVSKDINS